MCLSGRHVCLTADCSNSLFCVCICLSVFVSVCLSVYMYECMYACVYVHPSIQSSMSSSSVGVQCTFNYHFPCVSVLCMPFQNVYFLVIPFLYIVQPFYFWSSSCALIYTYELYHVCMYDLSIGLYSVCVYAIHTCMYVH